MHKTLAAAFVLALLPISGCLTDGSVSNVEAPAWKSGYSWSWETTTREEGYVEVEENGDSFREESDAEPFAWTETVEVLNTTTVLSATPMYLAAYRNSFMADQAAECPTVGPPGQGTEFGCFTYPVAELRGVRKSDLSLLPLSYGFTSSCATSVDPVGGSSQGSCRTAISNLDLGNLPPFPYLDFPLDSGKEWGGPLPPGEEMDLGFGEMEWVYEARVSGKRTVETALGPIEGIAVQYRIRPTDPGALERQIREDIESEGGDLEAFDFRASIAWNDYYSPVYENVVRSDAVVTIYLVIEGTVDGDHHRIELMVTETTESLLTGASLASKPERDFDYMARVIFGEIGVSDPSGNLPDPRHIGIEIEPAQPYVNAAADETASFTAEITDSSGNFTDMGVRWSVLDYYQDEVASSSMEISGPSSSFGQAVGSPGAYFVQADVYSTESNQVLASTQIPFEALYDGTISFDGSVVGTSFFGNFLPGNYEPQPIPVHPGVRLLEVTSLSSSGVAVTPSQIVVADAIGNTVDQDPEAVSVTDFSEYFVDANDWTVDWQQSAAVLEDAELRVLIRYGLSPYDADGGASGGFAARVLDEHGGVFGNLVGDLLDEGVAGGPSVGSPRVL